MGTLGMPLHRLRTIAAQLKNLHTEIEQPVTVGEETETTAFRLGFSTALGVTLTIMKDEIDDMVACEELPWAKAKIKEVALELKAQLEDIADTSIVPEGGEADECRDSSP